MDKLRKSKLANVSNLQKEGKEMTTRDNGKQTYRAYEPLNLQYKPELLQRIREFEASLSAEVEQAVSVVAYAPNREAAELGHS